MKALTIFVMAAALVLPACTDESSATRALKAQGMRDIEFTGYQPFDWLGGRLFAHRLPSHEPAG